MLTLMAASSHSPQRQIRTGTVGSRCTSATASSWRVTRTWKRPWPASKLS